MKPRNLLEPTFTDFNGNQWPLEWIDVYNQLQIRINACIAEGREPPQNLLDGSRNLYCSFADILRAERKG